MIYSDDITQHQSHVKEVLKRLQKAELYGVNQDVVLVDYYAHVQEVGEYIVHEALESSWSVS